MIRRRGARWPNELSSRMPGHDAEARAAARRRRSPSGSRPSESRREAGVPARPARRPARPRCARYSERPADRAVAADERDPLAQLGEGRAHRLPRRRGSCCRWALARPPSRSAAATAAASSRTRRRRGSTRRRPGSAPGAPTSVTTIGPSSAKPIANAALSVSVNTPFAASSCRRGTRNGIIAASAGPKNTVIVDTATLSTRMNARVWPARNVSTNAPARRRLVTIRIVAPVEPVDVDAGDGGEQHGRQRGSVRIRRLTAVFDCVASRMMTVRPKMTMLPPICVNAWASQSSRNGRLRKTSSAPPSSSSPASPFGAAVASSGWDVTGGEARRRR